MARKRKRAKRTKRGRSAWNRKFGQAAKDCHRESTSASGYGSCMREKLRSGRRKRRR